MKDIKDKGYVNEQGVFIEKNLPSGRVRCHWSTDSVECSTIAIKGNVFCDEHYEQVMKINGRKFKINPQVKETLLKNE